MLAVERDRSSKEKILRQAEKPVWKGLQEVIYYKVRKKLPFLLNHCQLPNNLYEFYCQSQNVLSILLPFSPTLSLATPLLSHFAISDQDIYRLFKREKR